MSLKVTPPLVVTTAGVVGALEVAAADVEAVFEAEAELGDVVVEPAELCSVTVEVVPAGTESDVEELSDDDDDEAEGASEEDVVEGAEGGDDDVADGALGVLELELPPAAGAGIKAPPCTVLDN